MGEQVGEAEGEAQRGDAGDHQVRHYSTQVQVPGKKHKYEYTNTK